MDIWKNFVNLFQNNGGDKQVLWQEMTYQTYVQNSDETVLPVCNKPICGIYFTTAILLACFNY